MMHLAAFGVLVVAAVVGTVGNLLVIATVIIYKRLRVRSHVFIVNLAVADLLVTSYIMPVGLATSRHEMNPFGKTICDLNAFLIITSTGVSTQTLMAIALERYFHICRTPLYRKLFTKKLMVFYVFFIWLYTITWTSQGFGPWTDYKYSHLMYICIFDGENSVSYRAVLAVVGMIIPILVVAICYFLILRTVRRGSKALASHRTRQDSPSSDENGNISTSKSLSTLSLDKEYKKQRKEHQLAVTLFTIVIIFILCWLPATFVLTFSNVWTAMPNILWPIAIWLAFCNSSVNSIVYGVMNTNFRSGYKELLEYICCFYRSLKCPSCTCSSPYVNEDSFNSQSKFAGAFTNPEESPTHQKHFRFSASNELKGYGSGSTTPMFLEMGRSRRASQNGDILRHMPPPSQHPLRSSTPPIPTPSPPTPPPPPPPPPPLLPSTRIQPLPKPKSRPPASSQQPSDTHQPISKPSAVHQPYSESSPMASPLSPPPAPPPPPLPPLRPSARTQSLSKPLTNHQAAFLPSTRPKPSSQPSTGTKPSPKTSTEPHSPPGFSPTAAPVYVPDPALRTTTPAERFHDENNNVPTRQSEEPLQYLPMHASLPEVEYVYGAFSCGNSSIITIGSSSSDESEYRRFSGRVNTGICSSSDNVSVLILPNQTTYESQADNVYDEIGNVHLQPMNPKPVVKTTNIIGLRNGDTHPIYEIPIPDGEGEIILPVPVSRTPVQGGRKHAHHFTENTFL